MIFIRPLLTRAEDVARAVREAVEHMPREIPVQAVFMSARDHAAMAKAGGIPTYLYPEDAAKALARVVRHVRWRARPRQEPLRFDDARGDDAAAVIARALEDGGEWLQIEAIDQLLDCYGVATRSRGSQRMRSAPRRPRRTSGAGSPSRRRGRAAAQDGSRGSAAGTCRRRGGCPRR